jgi:hypothetical protein
LKADFVVLVALEEYFGEPLLSLADSFIGHDATLTRAVEARAIILTWPANARRAPGREIVATDVGITLTSLQQFFLAVLGIETADQNGGVKDG